MNPAKIIVSEMQSASGFQVRKALRESVRQPRKSPHRHSHRQVLPLYERRADMVRVGIALPDLGYNPRDAWWGVPRIGAVELPEVAKHLGKLREVHFGAKALRNRHGVMVQSVCRELNSIRHALVQVPQESPGIGPDSLADAKRGNQFAFRVNGDVHPLIAHFGRIAGAHVTALLLHERPDFIYL